MTAWLARHWPDKVAYPVVMIVAVILSGNLR